MALDVADQFSAVAAGSLFVHADANGDGLLDVSELVALRHAEEDALADPALFDLDGNGGLEFWEVAIMLSVVGGHAVVMVDLHGAFNELDADADGTISYADFADFHSGFEQALHTDHFNTSIIAEKALWQPGLEKSAAQPWSEIDWKGAAASAAVAMPVNAVFTHPYVMCGLAVYLLITDPEKFYAVVTHGLRALYEGATGAGSVLDIAYSTDDKEGYDMLTDPNAIGFGDIQTECYGYDIKSYNRDGKDCMNDCLRDKRCAGVSFKVRKVYMPLWRTIYEQTHCITKRKACAGQAVRNHKNAFSDRALPPAEWFFRPRLFPGYVTTASIDCTGTNLESHWWDITHCKNRCDELEDCAGFNWNGDYCTLKANCGEGNLAKDTGRSFYVKRCGVSMSMFYRANFETRAIINRHGQSVVTRYKSVRPKPWSTYEGCRDLLYQWTAKCDWRDNVHISQVYSGGDFFLMEVPDTNVLPSRRFQCLPIPFGLRRWNDKVVVDWYRLPYHELDQATIAV